MGWSCNPSRAGRTHRCPDLEGLEVRQLLSLAHPVPAAGGGTAVVVRGDGSVNNDAVIQASSARATYRVDGTGSNVAVIDTGVNAANPAFGTGSVGQAGNKIVLGVDFTGSRNGSPLPGSTGPVSPASWHRTTRRRPG